MPFCSITNLIVLLFHYFFFILERTSMSQVCDFPSLDFCCERWPLLLLQFFSLFALRRSSAHTQNFYSFPSPIRSSYSSHFSPSNVCYPFNLIDSHRLCVCFFILECAKGGYIKHDTFFLKRDNIVLQPTNFSVCSNENKHVLTKLSNRNGERERQSEWERNRSRAHDSGKYMKRNVLTNGKPINVSNIVGK